MGRLPAGFLPRVLYIIERYGRSLMRGAGITLNIALAGTAVGCLIGFLLGLVRTIPLSKKDSLPKKALLRTIWAFIYCYVELFRGTPMMVQAMFIYYGAAYLFNIQMSRYRLFAGIFIVSINTGAYMTETVRGGILSIDRGQTEGAMAIGMNHVQTMLRVILPQALRNIMPQIGNNLIINIKDTCVLSTISVVELFFASKSVAGALYLYFETYAIVMFMYLVMTVFFSRVLRIAERKMDGPQSYQLVTVDQLTPTSGLYRYPDKKQVDE